MPPVSPAYRARRPEQSVLYQVVRDHLETFCLQSATLRGGEGLPRFVDGEFRAYLRCGWLAGGFARFRCAACGTDRLVAFSCKGRGFCPSCGARRMEAHTAHLVDHVFPAAPVRRRVLRLLNRRGHGVDADGFALDRWVDEAPVLAAMGAASVLGRAASGPRTGATIRRLSDQPWIGDQEPVKPRCHARLNGFDLHAGVVAPAGHRERLQRLCRYGLRPPIAEERLQRTPDDQVLLRLRHRWTDGTTHVLFEPTEFLERLAVITPRPRVNLVLYYGVLAPRAAWRKQVVGARYTHDPAAVAVPSDPPSRSGAALMRRVFGFEVLACPRCGRAMRLIALIEQGDVSRRILRHPGEATEVPAPKPARAPPQTYEDDDAPSASSGEDDAIDLLSGEHVVVPERRSMASSIRRCQVRRTTRTWPSTRTHTIRPPSACPAQAMTPRTA